MKKHVRNYNKKLWRLLSVLISSLVIVSAFSSASLGQQGISHRFLGYGPLKGESAMPVAVQMVGREYFAVLDIQKSSVILFNQDGSFFLSFPVSADLYDHHSALSFRTSPDGFIFLEAKDHLFVYSAYGDLVNQRSLHTIPGFQSGISYLLPLEENLILIYNTFTSQFSLHDLYNHTSPLEFPFDGSQDLFSDFFCFSSHIVILGYDYHGLNQKTPSLLVLSTKGDFEKKIDIPFDTIVNPLRISVTLDNHFILINENFDFAVINSEGNLLSKGQIMTENLKRLSMNFCGFTDISLLIPDFGNGILHSKDSNTLGVYAKVNSSANRFLAITAVTATDDIVAAYDELAERFIIFKRQEILRSFFLQDLPLTVEKNASVSLYASREWIYIVLGGSNLNILQYEPINGKITLLKLPEYISGRSHVYVRPNDGNLFIYSWFDGILYSLKEQSNGIEKTQIKRHESGTNAQNSICRVDNSGNIFILLPFLNKINVYSKDGSLMFSFPAIENSASKMIDFHFMRDYLVLLNYSESLIEIKSKRGEKIQSLGSEKKIMYPEKMEAYHQDKSLFFRPRALFCTEKDIYIADTGNNRIQILTYPDRFKKTVIELQIGSPSAYINGQRVSLDAPPFIESGRTLVPLRFIGEAFGAKVDWIAERSLAVISLDKLIIEVSIGNDRAFINGIIHQLDVAPMIKQGRTFVPLRFIGEAFGSSLVWEAESKRIIITYPGN
jgi:hypothetical protein